MGIMHITKRRVLGGMLVFLCGLILYTASGTALAQKKFASKECLDCHTKFTDKYMGMKNVHAVVKDKKCEECHLRHGRVPKLLDEKAIAASANRIVVGAE